MAQQTPSDIMRHEISLGHLVCKRLKSCGRNSVVSYA